ncbi:MAG: tetratricopeptide repeat protein [Planctomycetes bacterium]|nr:tetratricopeptide repeat protein [Planctomycetota bacterium]
MTRGRALRWLVATTIVLTLGIVILGRSVGHDGPARPTATVPRALDYVGSASCAACHPREYEDWRSSDHARAQAPVPGPLVIGAFDGRAITAEDRRATFARDGDQFLAFLAEGEGEPRRLPITGTIGIRPIQQYLVAGVGGRRQVLRQTWDARAAELGGQRWFELRPEEAAPPDEDRHWNSATRTWNQHCAECHVTGFEKRYDPDARSYASRWVEDGVGCESCHGRGSGHVAWAERPDDDPGQGFARPLAFGGKTWSWDAARRKPVAQGPASAGASYGLCAGCHAHRLTLVEAPEPVDLLEDGHQTSLLDEGLYFADGQIRAEVFVHGSFSQSRMAEKGVVCGNCHRPHDGGLRLEGNALCLQCHADPDFDRPAHGHHEPGSPGSFCVDCHMPARTYMGVDDRRDHRFGIPDPVGARLLGSPDPCSSCHQDREAGWVESAFTAWYGTRPGRHRGRGLALARGRRHDQGSVGELGALARDRDQPAIFRATALDLLRGLDTEAGCELALGLLRDPSPLVRRVAVTALAGLDPERRLTLIGPLLADPVLTVRGAAVRGLADLDLERLPAELRPAAVRALAELERGLWLNADQAAARFELGSLRLAQGRVDEARTAYEVALELEPRQLEAWINLADLARLDGNEAELRRILERAEAALGPCVAIQLSRGLSLVRDGRHGEAVAEFRRAAALEPGDPQVATLLALGLMALDRDDEAESVYRAALELKPDDLPLRAAYRDFLAARGRSVEAEEEGRQIERRRRALR